MLDSIRTNCELVLAKAEIAKLKNEALVWQKRALNAEMELELQQQLRSNEAASNKGRQERTEVSRKSEGENRSVNVSGLRGGNSGGNSGGEQRSGKLKEIEQIKIKMLPTIARSISGQSWGRD